ncbi:hypothetical protein H920_04824 [Fukomys damarensis]|uniref:Uncharacterized protein n=1 Tax=Fukomys damarensis TaxID=885580 RepID=A0A091DU85_FUKDA|nr:hypothetical protein H920_04824 [Fukomys damarensis]
MGDGAGVHRDPDAIKKEEIGASSDGRGQADTGDWWQEDVSCPGWVDPPGLWSNAAVLCPIASSLLVRVNFRGSK